MRKVDMDAIKIIICLSLCLTACDRERNAILNELKNLELTDYDERDLDKRKEKELLESIRFLENQVNRTIDAGAHLGTYYKLAAIEYRKRNMYGLAAEFFDKALGVSPKNHYLAYWAGVCTAQLAKSIVDANDRIVLLDRARDYYLYAIDLHPKYSEALYGLSVLLIFEYQEPAKAEVYLERTLAVESLNYRAMFLLARVHVIMGRIEEAIALFDRIVEESADDSMVSQARRNKNELLGGTYER